ncbi:MAG: hypothetical protein ABFS38_15745 [Bacteroidota bacterium]
MYLVILQAQSTAGAALAIIVMLLGAAIIGVVTTYLYTKSKFQKTISDLNAKLDASEKAKVNMSEEVNTAERELKKKSDQYDELEVKYNDLLKTSESLKKDAGEKDKELHEKDEQLKRISERKHLLDYSSFGTAKKEEKDDLQMISGIGPFLEEKLHMLDIFTFEQISKFNEEDREAVNEAIEFFSGRIERDEWISQAKELLYTGGKDSEVLENIAKRKHKINYDRIGIAHKENADDLTAIHGIGGWIQQKLYALDIFTYKQISKFSEEDIHSLTEVIEFFPGRIERDNWVSQAKELLS